MKVQALSLFYCEECDAAVMALPPRNSLVLALVLICLLVAALTNCSTPSELDGNDEDLAPDGERTAMDAFLYQRGLPGTEEA